MRIPQTAVKISLLALTIGIGCSYSWADDAYIPRLGYMSGQPARIYVDVVPPEVRQAQAKAAKETKRAQREEEKAAKKLAEENERKAKEAAKLAAKTEKAEKPVQVAEAKPATEVTQDDPQIMAIRALETPNFTATPATTNPALEAPLTAAPAATEPLKADTLKAEADNKDKEKEKKKNATEDYHRKALNARAARNKAKYMAMIERQAKEPVSGIYYLYSLGEDRLLYNQPAEPQASPKDKEAVAPYFVEFNENPPAGLYDLAVKGSGHRSEIPIRISDSIYWDALKPVAEGINKAHCPLERGRYRIVQQCYQMTVLPNTAADSLVVPAGEQKGQLVQGGWYSPEGSELSKSTNYIANLTQTLLRTYQLNPKAFKYLELIGPTYGESTYPDILDEANWGLQYLLTIQQADGTFPQGIIKHEVGERSIYTFSPPNPQASCRAIMALATAAKVFKDSDLSMSVKFMRAAEKGWQALTKTNQALDPEWVLLASSSLAEAGENPAYITTFEKAKSMVKSLTPDTAILLGDMGKDIPLEEVTITSTSKDISTVLPWLAATQRNEKTATAELEKWITDLFGYERVPFKRDSDLALADASHAPMEWLAGKTGEALERFGRSATQLRGQGNERPALDSMKDIEKKETEAKNRIQEGYKNLALSPKDNVYLTYTLALLNQQTSPTFNPELTPKTENKPKPYVEPVGAPKGHWPKLL